MERLRTTKLTLNSQLTSFQYTGEHEDNCRLLTKPRNSWDSYVAIHPSTHPSNNDILYLEKGHLEKPSYVRLQCVAVPISMLQTCTVGSSAKASDIRLKWESTQLLF